MTEITTDQIRKVLNTHFESEIWNPNWDVIADIVGELDPECELTGAERAEAEQAAYTLWSRGKVVF